MNDAEFKSVSALSAPSRYAYSVKRIADFEAIWSLKGTDAWVLAADDEGVEVIPVWPFAECASACAVGEWHGARPEPINLEALSKWLPGIKRDGRLIAVFPTPDSKAVVVAADRLSGDLEEELEQYE